MASTNYLTRAIFKKHTTDGDFSGTYNLLVKSKSMPAPKGTPNNVESTTFEDDTQTFEKGISQNENKEITGNLETEYLDAVEDVGDDKVDVIQLYGTDGIGGVAKYAYVGQISASPSDTSGTDGILEMAVTVIPNTTPIRIKNEYTIVDNKDGTFRVTKAS